MQSFILGRLRLQRLTPKIVPLNLRNYARTFASKEVENRDEDVGITGRRRRTKKRSKIHASDPDDEFMQMWSTTEGYIQDQLREVTTGVKMSRRKYVKVNRPNVSTLPLASELTLDERSKLLEDDPSVDFRIPRAEDFATLTPVFKSLTDEENFESAEENVLKVSEDKPDIGCNVIDTSRIFSFEDFNLHPKIIEKLKKYEIINPTPIQKQAIPLIMSSKSILIQSETGSGKTLVFLLPTIQDPGKSFGTVIVVPTRELASQLVFEAHRFLGNKTVVESFVSGVDMAKQEARLKDRTNRPLIAIGTPKRLLEIIDKDPLLVHRTKRLVIDEVDKTLLPLSKRVSIKKRTLRENHPRPAKLLVEKIKKYSRVIIN